MNVLDISNIRIACYNKEQNITFKSEKKFFHLNKRIFSIDMTDFRLNTLRGHLVN